MGKKKKPCLNQKEDVKKKQTTRSLTGVRLAAWQMRGGGGQSDGTQKRKIDAQMELRRTKEGRMVDNRKNKEEETELGANVLKKRRWGEWHSSLSQKEGHLQHSGGCQEGVTSSTARFDPSLCAREFKSCLCIDLSVQRDHRKRQMSACRALVEFGTRPHQWRGVWLTGAMM